MFALLERLWKLDRLYLLENGNRQVESRLALPSQTLIQPVDWKITFRFLNCRY